MASLVSEIKSFTLIESNVGDNTQPCLTPTAIGTNGKKKK